MRSAQPAPYSRAAAHLFTTLESRQQPWSPRSRHWVAALSPASGKHTTPWPFVSTPRGFRSSRHLAGVRAVRPVRNYQMHLGSTVPYIGAAAVQVKGVDGTGVVVAVLDSGIDYTHRNLGGPGTTAAYAEAYGVNPADPRNTTRDGLFPTDKVIEGFDFVGENWPNGPLAPDSDPIDFEGHGTHVADIIAGRSLDGFHKGVAPGASLMAFKVCSSVSTSCSGIALLQAMDAALDPNGDDDLVRCGGRHQHVARLGLRTTGGRPFRSEQYRRRVLAWSSWLRPEMPETALTSWALPRRHRRDQRGADACAHRDRDSAHRQLSAEHRRLLWQYRNAGLRPGFEHRDRQRIFRRSWMSRRLDFARVAGGSLSRRSCRQGGADRSRILRHQPEDRSRRQGRRHRRADRPGCCRRRDPFSFGGGTMFVPSLVITQATANLIKANLAAPVNVTISPDVCHPAGEQHGELLVTRTELQRERHQAGHRRAGCLRVCGGGLGYRSGGVQWNIRRHANGVGIGGALDSGVPDRPPSEIKAILMNTANTSVFINPATLPGVLAPVSRIGGGEVRVDQALSGKTAAWDTKTSTGSLSFGYEPASELIELARRVTVMNYSDRRRTYVITPGFRYANDAASGAVHITAPPTVTVPAHDTRSFRVAVTIDAAKLPVWTLNGGSQGGNGSLLQDVEFDGYIGIADDFDNIHMAWHVLPHKAAAVVPAVGQGDTGERNRQPRALQMPAPWLDASTCFR